MVLKIKISVFAYITLEYAADENCILLTLPKKGVPRGFKVPTYQFTNSVFCILTRGMFAMKKKNNDYGTGIPTHEIESLARLLLPKIQEFFASEEGQKEFSEWRSKQSGTSSNDIN